MMNKLAALLALTAGCATDPDGAFHVTGRLSDPSAVTHVVAWNAASGEHMAIDLKTDGQPDGEFDLALAPGAAWGVTFADAQQSGAAMRLATLQAGGLDVLRPQSAGAVDLGTISLASGRATGTLATDELVTALGLDTETAERMGRSDDLALRYSNPDVDNDGLVDALQGRAFRLDLAGQFRLQHDGRDLEIADIVRGTQPSALRYLGTSIMTHAPNTMDLEAATFRFGESFYGTALGPNTEMVDAGTPIGQPHVKFGERGSRTVSVFASPAHPVPSGTYDIGFGNGMLTFSEVHAPQAAMLQSASDHTVPFLRIRPAVAGCVHNCDIQSFELSWRRASAFDWIESAMPGNARLVIVAEMNGKRVALTAELEQAGTIAWQDMPVAGSGILRRELAYISTSSLCYVAVSYMSELGMKMTSQILNSACKAPL